MDEYMIKQKIQGACFEPRAPETLIRAVIIKSRAIAEERKNGDNCQLLLSHPQKIAGK